MEPNWVSVDACTLPTVEQPVRLAEFDALFTAHGMSANLVEDTRARLVFTGPIGLQDSVRELATRESQCCAFFDFTVSVGVASGREVVTLDVAVPKSRTAILIALVARAADRMRSAGRVASAAD